MGKTTIQALRDVINRHGRKRFGEPSPAVQAALQAITDAGRLQALSDRVLDVGTWEELLAEHPSTWGWCYLEKGEPRVILGFYS